MGTLYYAEREGDAELFALNKQGWCLHDAFEAFRPVGDEGPFTDLFPEHMGRDWARRVWHRLTSWAGERRVRVTDEYSLGERTDYTEKDITGSAFDEDYDAEGRYIPGSAW